MTKHLRLRSLSPAEVDVVTSALDTYQVFLSDPQARTVLAYAEDTLQTLQVLRDQLAQATTADGGTTEVDLPTTDARVLRLALDRHFIETLRTTSPPADEPLPEPVAALVKVCQDMDRAAEQLDLEWE